MEFEEREEQKLDLMTLFGDFFKIARRHILLLLALVIAGGAFFGVRAYRSYVPKYTASASVSVRVASPLFGGTAAYNTATAEQLDTLPGIGPAKAAAIIAWREEHGPFSCPEDLIRVSGIGEATLAKLLDQITVGGE